MREERRLRMFENRVLRRKSGPNSECRKLHNEKLNYLYCSRNIIREINSRMRWARHVARMTEKGDVYRVLVGIRDGKDHIEDPGVDGRISRCIFRK